MYGQAQAPVVVQGTVVNASHMKNENLSSKPTTAEIESGAYYNNMGGGGGYAFQKDEVPEGGKRCNDVPFAVLFVLQILVVSCLFVFLPVAEQDNGNGDGGGGGLNGDILYLVGVCAVAASIVSSGMLTFMMAYATSLVKIALIFSVTMSGVAAILGVLSGQLLLAIFGLVGFVIGLCYAYAVWDRIPFAAANLNTGCTAVKSNLGLAFVGYLVMILAVLWTIRWTSSVQSTVDSLGEGGLFFLLLSYFWTHQVLQNTMHVTTAGVVGTWWFNPLEASSFCSTAIRDSFARATTYSFGSICFGSLLVAIVQTLRQLNHMTRDQEDCNILNCIIDCILGCIEGILEYLNKWAYVYVGLYGYGYIDAGRNVMSLFQHKGWTVIITDDLVDNVLFMMSGVIGIVTGVVGAILSVSDRNMLASLGVENVGLVGFGIGFLVGYVISSILMSIVASAVNTVIVCFAESPNEFQSNHPQLSLEMRQAWRNAWPNECGNL